MSVKNVTIIGSGPAGLTAGIYSARANLAPLLLHGPLAGGQLTTTTDVENFPGFPDGIMGPDLMKAMEDQAKKFGCQIQVETVTEVNLSQRPFTIKTDKGEHLTHSLIIASGANPRYLNIPGEMELLGYGVSTCATCDGAFFRDETIVVVGGGDSACEEAQFLSRFGSKVYLVHRRDSLRASKIMQDRIMNNPKIEILWNKYLTEVHGKKPEGVTHITLKDSVTEEISTLNCAGIFVAIGHVPNSKLFANYLKLDENGYIIPESGRTTATSVKGVFVCGDVQDSTYRQAITAAGTGCMASIEAERFLESLHL
jgi:thioredoxin reductase (NADPH)